MTAHLAAALLLVMPLAEATDWTMVPAESRLEFIASYEGQTAPGVFKRFDTRLRFDPARPLEGNLRVIVDTASADMHGKDINEAIALPEWLAVARFPVAVFQSSTIEAASDGHFIAKGKLRLKDVEREVAVPFLWRVTKDAARISGTLVLKRSDFNIGSGEWAGGDVIGIDVRVEFDVSLRRSR